MTAEDDGLIECHPFVDRAVERSEDRFLPTSAGTIRRDGKTDGIVDIIIDDPVAGKTSILQLNRQRCIPMEQGASRQRGPGGVD